jgi:hypothetical protein
MNPGFYRKIKPLIMLMKVQNEYNKTRIDTKKSILVSSSENEDINDPSLDTLTNDPGCITLSVILVILMILTFILIPFFFHKKNYFFENDPGAKEWKQNPASNKPGKSKDSNSLDPQRYTTADYNLANRILTKERTKELKT